MVVGWEQTYGPNIRYYVLQRRRNDRSAYRHHEILICRLYNNINAAEANGFAQLVRYLRVLQAVRVVHYVRYVELLAEEAQLEQVVVSARREAACRGHDAEDRFRALNDRVRGG